MKLLFLSALLLISEKAMSSVMQQANLTTEEFIALVNAGSIATVGSVAYQTNGTALKKIILPTSTQNLIPLADNSAMAVVVDSDAIDIPIYDDSIAITASSNYQNQLSANVITSNSRGEHFLPVASNSSWYTAQNLANWLLSLSDENLNQASIQQLTGSCRYLDVDALPVTKRAGFSCRRMIISVPESDESYVLTSKFPARRRAECLPGSPISSGAMGCGQGAQMKLCRETNQTRSVALHLRAKIATTLLASSNSNYDQCRLTLMATRLGSLLATESIDDMISSGKFVFFIDKASNRKSCSYKLTTTQSSKLKPEKKFEYGGNVYTSMFNQDICRVAIGRARLLLTPITFIDKSLHPSVYASHFVTVKHYEQSMKPMMAAKGNSESYSVFNESTYDEILEASPGLLEDMKQTPVSVPVQDMQAQNNNTVIRGIGIAPPSTPIQHYTSEALLETAFAEQNLSR